MTFLARASRSALDHLCTLWSVWKTQTLTSLRTVARGSLVGGWEHLQLHPPLKDCRISGGGADPSVSPSRGGQPSDRALALLRVTSGGPRFISQQAPVSVLNSLNRRGKVGVAASAVISPVHLLWKHLQACERPTASPETRSELMWQALRGQGGGVRRSCCSTWFWAEKLWKGQGSPSPSPRNGGAFISGCCGAEGRLQVSAQRLRFTVLTVASVSAEWLTCTMTHVRVGLIIEEQEWWNKRKLCQRSGPSRKGISSRDSACVAFFSRFASYIIYITSYFSDLNQGNHRRSIQQRRVYWFWAWKLITKHRWAQYESI